MGAPIAPHGRLARVCTLDAMSELAERSTEVVADTVNGIVSQGAAGLMAAAGVALNNPDLIVAAAPGGALAGALSAQGVAMVRRAWRDKGERVDHFAETAAKAAGMPVDDMIEQATKDYRLRELLAQAVGASANSYDFEKIDIFARVFAHGAKDGTRVDELLILIDLVRDLDVARIRVIAAIYNAGGGHQEVTPSDIRLRDSGVGGVLVPLLKRLEDQGLVALERKAPETLVILSEIGLYLAQQLEAVGVRR